MKTKYQIYSQDYEDIFFNWFEADDSLEKKLSKYFNILSLGSKKCKGTKINPIKHLKELLGKRPIYRETKDEDIPSGMTGSFMYIKPPTKEEVEFAQMLWDKENKEITKIINLLK